MNEIQSKYNIHLNLKKVWFDLILSGEKPEEYREIKPSFLKLLTNIAKDYEMYEGLTKDIALEICNELLNFESNIEFKNIKTITFSNGYRKDRRQFVIELKYIKIGYGKPEWGAEPNQKYFVLNLGKIIKYSL